MKIVVLDGYAANPGDLSWEGMKVLGECTIYDRTAPEEVLERAAGADARAQADYRLNGLAPVHR